MKQFNLRYRPNKFSEYVGNTEKIQGLLASFPDWPQCFLLAGKPGLGKTTLARIIASQLDCNVTNLREVDAGQDRGIEKTRALIESTYSRPLVGKVKVYIIDECQGLTADAQQALLKVAEEPPKDTYFIFCSTDPEKISKALRSRCQHGRIDLEPLSNKELGAIIKSICDQENIDLTKDSIKKIATLCIYKAEGVPRDAIMLFNKFYQYDDPKEVEKVLSSIDPNVPEELWEMVNALDKEDIHKFLTLFSQKKGGNWEGFRITFGNLFKGKLLRAMIAKDKNKIDHYSSVLSCFTHPVHNNFGDMELIYRFSMCLPEKNEIPTRR